MCLSNLIKFRDRKISLKDKYLLIYINYLQKKYLPIILHKIRNYTIAKHN